ncbi:MAG TPA: ABC transporter substrate-binding protein, partial [Oligoflexia bacterium]|nr:ABC transporter substrate-binding protein [Oligoflexia bacterium]
QAARAIAATKKLVEQDKVLGVIVFGSGTSAAVSLLLERKKIPAITIAMSEDVVRNREFIFRHYLPLSAQSNAIAAEVDRRNYHRIAVIATQQEAMLRFRDVFRQRFVNRIVLDEQVLPGEVDFSALVTRLRRANPEAVYLLLMPPELSVLPRRLREAKLEAEFFGSAQLQNPAVLAAANGALDGVWFTGVDDRRAQPLFREYQREFGELPVPDAVHAYEAALLFIAALRNVPDDVRSYLANPSGFRGALGEYGIVPPNTYEVGAVLKQITPQGFVYLRQAALE